MTHAGCLDCGQPLSATTPSLFDPRLPAARTPGRDTRISARPASGRGRRRAARRCRCRGCWWVRRGSAVWAWAGAAGPTRTPPGYVLRRQFRQQLITAPAAEQEPGELGADPYSPTSGLAAVRAATNDFDLVVELKALRQIGVRDADRLSGGHQRAQQRGLARAVGSGRRQPRGPSSFRRSSSTTSARLASVTSGARCVRCVGADPSRASCNRSAAAITSSRCLPASFRRRSRPAFCRRPIMIRYPLLPAPPFGRCAHAGRV